MTDLAIRDGLTADQIDLLKRTMMDKQATDDELALFVQICNRTGLDPFARQIYAVRYAGKQVAQVSIDGARLIAERSGRYRPGSYHWCGPDGEWREVWNEAKEPFAAKATIYKDGMPYEAIAHWSEYVKKKDGKRQGLWDTMPRLMIAKCAEMLALRRGFPAELSGLYAPEEIGNPTTALEGEDDVYVSPIDQTEEYEAAQDPTNQSPAGLRLPAGTPAADATAAGQNR
jgi:phage recombination protein Bet